MDGVVAILGAMARRNGAGAGSTLSRQHWLYQSAFKIVILVLNRYHMYHMQLVYMLDNAGSLTQHPVC